MKLKLVCLFLIFISACKNNDPTIEKPVYFDVATYFKQEAVRLTKNNKQINKTVIVNNNAENKKVLITNWQQELSSFIDADINKASWRGSFKIIKTDSLATYVSQSDKIPVKKVEISLLDQTVVGVKIFITNKNVLYTSNDTLTYYPDSLYEIKKSQKIKLMDGKRYIIIGKFD